MRVIYISGPMTGLPDLNFPEFYRVADRLYAQGYEVINPADIEQPDKSWEACMRRDIVELMKADTLALLKGWQKSKGVGLEISIAVPLGMKVVDAYALEPFELDVVVDIKERGVK